MNKILFSILLALSAVSAHAEGNHKGGHGHGTSQAVEEEHGHEEAKGHAHDAGKGHGAGAHWMSPESAAAKMSPMMADMASIGRGKQSYFQYCSACHGADATGNGPAGAALNPKPADLKAMSGGHPDGDFAWKIANGRGAMPAWKTTLNENQIWDLVNYIQNLNGGKKMKAMDHSKMKMDDMKDMDHSKMDMSKMGHSNEDDHHKAESDGHHKGKSHTH